MAGRRQTTVLVATITTAIVVLAALVLLTRPSTDGGSAGVPPVSLEPTPGVVIGDAGGAVVSASPSPTPSATPTPTASPTPPPPVVTPPPLPVATPAPTAVPPPPATPAPTAAPVVTPAPTPVVVALTEPDAAVAAFYAFVVDEEFDAAYALWSQRMREAFPREENLDGRFDETVAIDWIQLETVAESPMKAQVQANFVETYEGGSRRLFVGYWDLVLVDGRWLLDEPHY